MIWTVVRVYGRFAWPPIAGEESEAKLADGFVEFGYADLDAPLGRQPFMRWVSRAGTDSPIPITNVTKHLAAFDDSDRNALRAAAREESFAYLLGKADPSAVAPAPAYLRFRGAVVLEQWHEVAESPAQPMMRWLLARSYWRGENEELSEVLVGLKGDKPKQDGSSFTLALALPTPVALSGTTGKEARAFPFVARYRPARTTFDPSQPLDVDALASGTFKEAAPAATLAKLKPPLHANYLGGFGFCRTDGGKDALYLPRLRGYENDVSPPEPGTKFEADRQRALRDAVWLSDRDRIAADLLGPLLSSDPKISKKITTIETKLIPISPVNRYERETKAGGEKRNSIFFSGESDGSRTVMRFRHAVEARGTFSTGKLRIQGGDFLFEVPELDGKLLQSNSPHLIIEFMFDYRISKDEIWEAVEGVKESTGNSFPDIELTVLCGFKGTTANIAQTASAKKQGAAMLFQTPARATRLAREALARTDGAQPDSVLPDIEFDAGTDFRLAYVPALDVGLDRRKSAILSWRVAARGPQAPLGRLTLWPERAVQAGRASDAAPLFPGETYALPISLSFPGFQLGDAEPIRAHFVHDKAALGRMGHERHPISVRIVPVDARRSIRARLGGLGFTIARPVLRGETSQSIPGESHNDYSVWRFDAGDPVASPVGESSHALRLRFIATAIDPLGPDIMRGDRTGRPRPLLLPLGRSTPTSKDGERVAGPVPYVIEMRETIGARTDRLLTADVKDIRGDDDPAPADRYVILSNEPFSITLVEVVPLRKRGSAEKASVASYSSDTRGWSFKRVSDHYHYVFQAQAIGESMDKPGRLEIHDPAKTPSDPDAFCPPFAPGSGTDPDIKVLMRHIVGYRLTPSAEIWIRPSDTEQGFFRPEWATHELFREAGAFGLGAALEAFRTESLYGMPAGVNVSLERGAAGGARVAEVEALVGRPLGAIASAAVDRDITERWARITSAIARRPERLEFWMRAPGPASTFAPARFAESVNFALRDSAVHQPPLLSPLIDPAKSAGPRVRSHGLRGGAIWPLESALFAQRLLEAPHSSAGTIERIALSPLGGDADQRGEFLAGQLAIISETRGGRVQRHRVETIGRISIFWHRAKHVVIYERTVNPTQQFGPEGGIKTRSRRPILRKVSEFIELIEPVRRYPDDPAADAMTAGFLKAVRFNSKVIAVDSAWSEDIPDAGWRIPLWNRHAARQRPSVYPRPDVVTVTAAEGPEDQPVIAQEILDPDNLFFFADSVAGHADTDRWIARAGIDYTKMPAPSHRQQQSDSADRAKRTTGRLPAAPRIPRGHRRFTWQLGPAARKTRINAGRAEEPIFAALETLSFQRATQIRTREGLDERTRIEEIMHAAGRIAGGDILAEKLARFKAAAVDPSDDKALLASARDLVGALNAAVAARHDRQIKDVKGLIEDAPAPCDRMIDQLTGGIERQKLLILDAVRTWQSDAARTLKGPDLVTRKAVVDSALAQLDQVISPLLAGAADQLGRIEEGAERARHAVKDVEADLFVVVDRAQRRLVALKASYDRSKPWSAARVTEIHARLQEIRDGLIGDIETAVSDIRSRLATDLDGLARRLGVETGTLVNALLTKVAELRGLADRRADAINDWLTAIQLPLARLEAPDGPLERARTAIGKIPDPREDLRTEALALVDAAKGSAHEVLQLIDKMKAGIVAGRVTVDKAVATVQQVAAAKRAEAAERLAELKQLIDQLGEPELKAIKADIGAASEAAGHLIDHLADMGKMVDALVDDTAAVAARFIAAIPDETAAIFVAIDLVAGDVKKELGDIKEALAPGGTHSLYDLLKTKVIIPALDDSFAILDDVGEPDLERLERALDNVGDALEERIKTFAHDAREGLGDLTTKVKVLCEKLGSGLNGAAKDLGDFGQALEDRARAALGSLNGALADAQALRALAEQIGTEAEAAREAVERSWVGAQAYADSVFSAAGQVGKGDLAAAPGQILRLYAAVASAPILPNLDMSRERLGYFFDEINKVIDTTPVEAWFGRLGEALKAMGLELKFDKLGNWIILGDLSRLDIGRVFRNFGGLDLSKLFKGVKLPSGAKDAIKLTHSFDKKQARAWVQIDISVSLPGRRSLLAIGPFKLDFVDARLAGVLRVEASKDSDTLEQTGRAQIFTDIDAVVSGQSMVRLEKLVIHYEKSSGLKVDFDPRNIKINPSLRFVQDTLGKLIPDTVGGLKVIKQQGIPVGVSHDFQMPPINLMAVTSGVSNIWISNHFSLIAYPDFIIADRFCLSRPDLPFLFSIFVIGGTGYIMVDVDYRPFSSALMVTVEAAAGGSAALGFAVGPVSGSVFITLSVALSYRKLIGRPGGGLTIACVLLIAGNVDVAGLATVYIGLLLRMDYRENGQIDGNGSLKITIRVSRFFKYTVRRDVRFKLRSGSGGGESSGTLASPGRPTAADSAQSRADKILAARS